LSAVYKYRRKRARQTVVRRGQIMRTRFRALVTLAFFVAILGTLGTLGAAFLTYRTYAHDLKPPEQAIADASFGNSLAFDRTGQSVLYQYKDDYGGLKNPVPLTEISPWLIAATIATEDSSFYGNPGVNFRGLGRAAWENLTPFGPGFLEGSGGSSITQQLVKNVYIEGGSQGLAPRTVDRKIKETVIALELKRKYSDNQILEWYLNQVNYANNSIGAEAAAKAYFGKSAKDLSLEESAFLAGLPQAPAYYLSDPALAKARQIQVLDLLRRNRDDILKIKHPADPGRPLIEELPDEAIEYVKTLPLNFVENNFDIQAPHFVFLIEDQVNKMCAAGLFDPPGDISCDKATRRGGLRITTTIDLGLQDIGQRIVEQNIAANENRYGGHNGSLVAIRPATGEVLAYVGSRDYFREDIDGQVDIASSQQSHGSTMKVFTYLTAFEQGWVPSTLVKDAPLFLDTGVGKKQVNNWNFSHMGDITIRKALSESVNTTAVRTVMDVGMDNMRETAHRFGITDLRQGDCGPTITLGACEVKLLDMTFAFATMANGGAMRGRPTSEDLPAGFRELDPVSVLKIEDDKGNVLYNFETPEERRVTEPAYAYMLTDVLSREAINWSRLTVDRPASAKTGTSEDFRDGVVMGYTPDLAAGVWMGNADNTPMAPGTFSSAGTGPMWRQFMREAHSYMQVPPRGFEKPADVVTSSCGGRDEVFKVNSQPAKPGTCRAPVPRPAGSPTPKPAPSPRFPPKNTPTPSPSPEPTPTPAPTPEVTPSPTPQVFYYTVEPGDTLADIAARFNTTVEIIAALNNLDPSKPLIPGTVLAIPVPPSREGNTSAFGAAADRPRRVS
jgi:membrane peptidoglycan carboxypeptidase